MKFPDKFKISLTNFMISQIDSSDDLQPPQTILSTQLFINMISVSLMQGRWIYSSLKKDWFCWKPDTCTS